MFLSPVQDLLIRIRIEKTVFLNSDPPDPDPVPWSWTGSTLLAEWIRLAKTGTDKEFLFKHVSYNPDNDADPCL